MTLRVLALCGFTQNAFIYSRQLGAIRKTLKNVEFVFLEPPIVVEQADMPWNSSLSEFDSTATTESETQTPETTPRAWWLSTKDRTSYRRLDESFEYIHEYLSKNPPFDGIMGFSQGAAMAALLISLLHNPSLHPYYASHPPLPSPPPKFLISVGGFLPSPESPSLSAFFPIPESIATLHVIGRGDVVVNEERSMTLVDKCEKARVEYHDGGHFTPSKASWRHFLNAYISSFAEDGSQGEDIGPPVSFGPSGTSTPNPATPRAGTPTRT